MNDFAAQFFDVSRISLWFPVRFPTLYFALYFTLNVRILGEVQPAELIDRGEKSDFFKSPKKISKNDVSSVQENSKNVANASTASDIELVIFLSTIFPWPGMDLPAARDVNIYVIVFQMLPFRGIAGPYWHVNAQFNQDTGGFPRRSQVH